MAFLSNIKMMSLNTMLLRLDKQLEEDNKFNEYLKKAEEFSGIERRKIVLGGGSLLAALVIIGYGAQLICNAIGFAYPAYCSIIAIETKQKEDDTIWLTYWVVFAALSLCEFFSEIIISIIPFYWLLKSLFLIWCFLPNRINGSKFLYYNFVRPVFLSHLDNKTENTPDGVSENHDKES